MQHLVSSQRKRLAHPNQIVRPAHPAIADALCAAGRNFADSAEPIVESLVDWRLELVAVALFSVGCFVFSIVAPHLPALGRWIAP